MGIDFTAAKEASGVSKRGTKDTSKARQDALDKAYKAACKGSTQLLLVLPKCKADDKAGMDAKVKAYTKAIKANGATKVTTHQADVLTTKATVEAVAGEGGWADKFGAGFTNGTVYVLAGS